MPKVSIVLPCYNGEKYLRESINSIIKQTYQDWELIIVDDCSVDRSLEIAYEYMKNDSRIKVIHNESNCKLPCSLNIGFANATGELLSWTSDDNIYYPEALEIMVDALKQNQQYYCVRANLDIIDEYGNIMENLAIFDNVEMYRYNCFGACFLYRRCVQEKIGFYNTNLFGVEDYEYWLRIMACYGDILSINKTLYQYRRHEGSLSETKKKMVRQQLNRMRLQFIDPILENLKDKPGELCGLYIEMKSENILSSELIEKFDDEELPLRKEEKFEQFIPEIKGIESYSGESALVFGAGALGKRIEKILKGKVVCFADNDNERIGQLLENREIISFDEMVRKQESIQIIIAVGLDRIYELMVQLWNAGIQHFVIAQEILWLNEK